VLTGGLGQLGREFTSALAARGAKVAIFDIDAGKRGISSDRYNVLSISVDVTRREAIEAGLKQVNDRWGTPHALINAAALDSPPDARGEVNGPFESYPETSWDQVLNVNVKGVFLCCQVVGAQMAPAGRGSIINIGSIYGLVSPDQRVYEYRRKSGAPFYKPAAYSASKSALVNLTRYLATYWAKENLRVNMLTFGGVYNNQDEAFVNAYAARVPLGRMAHADEYNGAVIFLISDASSYMTGSNLIIDGGWTAW
jgi:NAD(P)-dependent dehydrogenase (short-subunit alcohol dehydrogenase family)